MLYKSSISLLAVLFFISCGGGGSQDEKGNNDKEVGSRSVTIERGALYHAHVVDDKGQEGIDNGTNVYTFTHDITFPVTATKKTDGSTYIDVDNNKNPSAGDMDLDITLKSCSKNVTPITTLVANATGCDKTKVEAKYKKLSKDLNVSVENLQKLPSHLSNNHDIIAHNAVYLKLHGNSHDINHDEIKHEMENIHTYTKDLTTCHEIEVLVLQHNNHHVYNDEQAKKHPSHKGNDHEENHHNKH